MKINLTPLGTCACNDTPIQNQSGYVLDLYKGDNHYQLLLDAGTDRVMNSKFVNPMRLHAIILSHYHIDHTRQMPYFIKRLRRRHNKRRISIMAHRITWFIISWYIRVHNFGIIPNFVERKLFGLPLHYSHFQDFRLLLGNDFSIRIKAAKADHSPDCLAYRLRISELSRGEILTDFVYSPDTRFDSYHLCDFAANTQYWLLDTTFSDNYVRENMDNRFFKHSSPKYSGMMCRKAKANCYVATHYFWERFGPNYEEAVDEIRCSAETYYDGNIIVARELKPVNLFDSDKS